VAKLLVQHGADVNRRESYRDQSALMWAAAQGHATWWQFLVSQKADLTVKAKDNEWMTQISSEPRVQYRPTGGLTPLLYAARAGCLACVTSIVQAGANVDRPNPDGMTPMMMALDNGYPKVAQLPPRSWRQPAHVGLVGPHAALHRGDDARRTGQSSRARGLPSRSPSSMRCSMPACIRTRSSPSRSRAAAGATTASGDDLLTTGATPLLRAAQTFDNDVVRALLAHGALVDLPNASGVTPFMAAAGLGTRTGSSVLGPGCLKTWWRARWRRWRSCARPVPT
jgi:ankyrin repeat protein